MKKKLIFAGVLMLTVCGMRSQDSIAEAWDTLTFPKSETPSSSGPEASEPICFPFWMVQHIALDLAEKRRLEARERIHVLEISGYKSLVEGLQRSSSHRELQLELLRRSHRSLEVQLQSVRASTEVGGPGQLGNSFRWILRILGAFGVGYFVGSVAR